MITKIGKWWVGFRRDERNNTTQALNTKLTGEKLNTQVKRWLTKTPKLHILAKVASQKHTEWSAMSREPYHGGEKG